MVTISIIVACYNVELFIVDCVKSIVRQTFRDIEIILVNDGSTDGTGCLCNQLATSHSNIRIIHQDNHGVSAARRSGLLIAQGRWVAFVDGDDTLPERALEIMHEECTKKQVDVYIGSRFIQTDNGYSPRIIDSIPPGIYSREAYIGFLADYKVPMSVHSKLFRKDFLCRVDVCIPRWIVNNEDYLYNLFVSSNIRNVFISREPVYIYNELKTNNYRKGRATKQRYTWDYWEKYFAYLYENYRIYDVSDNTYVHSVLTKLAILIRNNQDYKNINMDIPPLNCIGTIKSLNGFDIWQILVIIIYRYRWLAFFLMPIMRIHPKRWICKIRSCIA